MGYISIMNKWSPKSIALALYHIVFATILLANFRIDRWLMGWDGLYPELNIPLNIIRGLTAGWQEYYGAGLVGGHGFAATLPHTLIIGIVSIAIPQHLVREVFIFLCYYLGGLGMLVVAHEFIKILFHKESWSISVVAALYYLLNLGTIQTFYLPLEAFTVHFAALPWLTYETMLLLEKRTAKRVATFLSTLLVSSIQGFIPAVFVAYTVSLALLTGTHLVVHRSKQALTSIICIWLCVLAANAYWLGSVGYFTITGSKDYVSAYNNIVSTPEFIAKSIKFGSLLNVSLLKSLAWDSNELGGAMMRPWINHFTNPLIPAIGYGLFALAIVGLIAVLIRKQNSIGIGLSLSFLYFFGSMAIDMPPFSWLTGAIQSYSPSLMQAFRTTFTKFGVGMSFHYSLFIAIGLYTLFLGLKRIPAKIPEIVLPILAAGAIIIYALPIWNNGLIYQKLFVTLPKPYMQMMTYINRLPDGRIADFPQDCAEGWYNDLWGYFGSGFLWYGINKPVMARAFDVWSHTNENYYWELSTALRQQDYPAVERIFAKYDIRYILYDQNLTHCRSQKGFSSSLDFLSYLSDSGLYTTRATYSTPGVLPITVFERTGKPSSSYIRLSSPLPTGPRIGYADTDPTYKIEGDYQTANTEDTPILFSKRGDPIPAGSIDTTNLIPLATASAVLSEPTPCGQRPAVDGETFSLDTRTDNVLRWVSTNTDDCIRVSMENINTSAPYILGVTSRHVAGEPLSISVTSKGRSAGLDISLPKHTNMRTDYYFLPPSFRTEVQYDVTVQNSSYNTYSSINDIGDIRLFAYQETETHTTQTDTHQATIVTPQSVFHPVSGLYIVTTGTNHVTTNMLLSQAYDTGWYAYDLSAKTRLKNHTLVNNWENGWELPVETGHSIVIIYLPQLLEYLGFLCIPIAIWIISTLSPPRCG